MKKIILASLFLFIFPANVFADEENSENGIYWQGVFCENKITVGQCREKRKKLISDIAKKQVRNLRMFKTLQNLAEKNKEVGQDV